MVLFLEGVGYNALDTGGVGPGWVQTTAKATGRMRGWARGMHNCIIQRYNDRI